MKKIFLRVLVIVLILLVGLIVKVLGIYEESTSYLFFSYDGFEIEGSTIIKYNKEGGNVVIPSVVDGVVITEIGDNAFNGLNIDSVIIPDTVVKIGDYAFANNNIRALKIPDSVEVIGEGAFIHNVIEDVVIDDDVWLGSACFNDNKLDSSGAFFYNDGELISYGGEVKGNVEVPDVVSVIGEKAFFESYIVSISISDSVEVIEDEAFKGNYLVELYLPSNIKEIGEDAFDDNLYLSDIVIDNVTNSVLNYPWGADDSNLYWTK